MGNVPQDCTQGICWAGNREQGSQTLTKGPWEALELEFSFSLLKKAGPPLALSHWDLLLTLLSSSMVRMLGLPFLLAFPLPLCFSLAQLSSSRLSYQPAVLGLGSADLAYPVVFTAGLNTTHAHQVPFKMGRTMGFPGLPPLLRSNRVTWRTLMIF